MKQKDQRIIFFHIMKTAGTTFNDILCRHFPKKSRFRFRRGNRHWETLENMSAENKNKIRTVYGHVPFGIHSLFPENFKKITFLRDPVSRVVSQYYFAVRELKDEAHQIVNNMSFEEFVKSGLSAVNNFQTRRIIGLCESGWDMRPAASLPAKALETAKENLRRRFEIVGVSEAFDETLLILKKIYGWKNIFYVKKNITSYPISSKELPPEIFKILREQNALDAELYDFAKQLLSERIREYGPSFEGDLKRFRFWNRILRPVLLADAAVRVVLTKLKMALSKIKRIIR